MFSLRPITVYDHYLTRTPKDTPEPPIYKDPKKQFDPSFLGTPKDTLGLLFLGHSKTL